MNNNSHFEELKKEVLEVRDRYPHLSLDNCFVVWFLRAFITDDEKAAAESVVGGSGDKNIDAVYIDHNSRNIFIVQGKYHQTKEFNEKRSDIIALADLGRSILIDSKLSFESILKAAAETVVDKLQNIRQLVRRKNYKLVLQFVSTGKISNTHSEEAEKRIDDWDNARFESFSKLDLMKLMQDYLEGAAPPTPSILIPIAKNEVLKRHDKKTNITTWLFTIEGKNLAEIYNSIGLRLFARNIRGYLGNTKINKGMKYTIKKEPEYFWYYNNGITIVCDEAKKISKRDSDILKVTNAQIINGQQTTRSLAEIKNNQTEVLVKLIELTRSTDTSHSKYKRVVSEIVSATNWQNSISQPDLKSNEEEQVRIERELKKYGYFYLRKTMKKSEAYKYGAKKYHFIIRRNQLARYIAATEFDPYEIRLGIDYLFEEDKYYIIYNGRRMDDYLLIYWFGRNMDWLAQWDTSYRYSKWHVYNFIWKEVKDIFRSRVLKDNFRFGMERVKKYEKQLKPIDDITVLVFRWFNQFYKLNSKMDGKRQERIDFFKHVDLDKSFLKYFRTIPFKEKKQLKLFKQKFVINLQNIS